MSNQPPPPAHRPLPYDIVYASSEDEPFYATELLREEEEVGSLRGWQSAKNAKFPQIFVLRFPCDVEISQLQILSHECKIASKVEVRVFSLRDAEEPLNMKAPPTFKDAKFAKLGSVAFNSNEKSKFRSKERKTVHLKTVGYFLKLVLHKPHQNPLNMMGQVGIYSIVCVGQLIGYPLPRHADDPLHMPAVGRAAPTDSPMSENGLPPIHHRAMQQLSRSPQRHHTEEVDTSTGSKAQRYGASPRTSAAAPEYNNTASPGNSRLPNIDAKQQRNVFPSTNSQPRRAMQQPYDVPHPHPQDISNGFRSTRMMEFESFYVRKTHEMASLKAQAIEVEDFAQAKDYKDQLIHLQNLSDQIYMLETIKVRAIYGEDFDEAKRIKRQMDDLIENAYETCGGGTSLQHQSQSDVPVHGGGRGGYNSRNNKGPSEDRPVVEMPPIDPSKQNNLKHAFEDEPVKSKYAVMMAQKRQENPEPEPPQHHQRQNSGQEHPADADSEGSAGSADDEGPPPPSNFKDNTRKPTETNVHAAATAATASEPTEDEQLNANAFNPALLPKWEQDVYRTIHALTDETAAESVVPANSVHTEAAEFHAVIGKYATSCLLSKRWKLREAAIRAITENINTVFTQASPTNVVITMTRFFDFKGCGLQDTISNVVVASCAFLQHVLKGNVEDASISYLLPNLANLLPRLVFRGCENLAKIRDPSIATILEYSHCAEFGVDRVVNFVCADPVDQDKRKISGANVKVQLTRLSIMLQILEQHRNYIFPGKSFDNFMTSLMLPCLNHQSSEVRDAAVKVMGALDPVLEYAKYLTQIQNPAVVNVLQRSTSSLNNSDVVDPEEKKKKKKAAAGDDHPEEKKRNTSAPKRAAKVKK